MTTEADRLAALAGEKYIRLTTYRKDGTEASTPVWVVSDDGRRLLVWTGVATWKVRRIRRDRGSASRHRTHVDIPRASRSTVPPGCSGPTRPSWSRISSTANMVSPSGSSTSSTG